MSTSFLGQSVSARARSALQTFAALETSDRSAKVGWGATSDGVRQATVEAMDRHDCDHYTRRPGLAALGKRVAEQLAERSVDVDPANGVIITGSVQEARFVVLRSLAIDKSVYVPGPVPPDYNAGIDFAGANVQAIDPEGSLPTISGDLLILPNPHLTLGQPLAQATLNRLAAWAVESDLTVIADETLASQLSAGTVVTSVAALPDMASRTVILGSYDAPGLAAWQVSWVAGPTDLVTTVRDVKQAMTICTPAPSQYAALASFDDLAGSTRQGRQ